MLDPTRDSRLKEATSKTFDVLVIGGGIVGMSAARDAAIRGYRVLLLEAEDYAFGTSSRSSKLLHGGLRYLEQGDLGLVREALFERERFVRLAPHLCRPLTGLVPVLPGKSRPAWQIHLGLKLYDALAGGILGAKRSEHFPSHQKLSEQSAEAQQLRNLGLHFNALFSYTDGQMEDTRLVIEMMLDASELHATTLNYARFESCAREGSVWRVQWKDKISGETLSSSVRFIINAAGPWVDGVAKSIQGKESNSALRFSRGTHLLFDTNLGLPGLTLSTGEKGRVYFILPYHSPYGRGTLVGTTERECPANEDDPQATEDEKQELLGRLQKDLPNAELSEKNLFRTFAGMRVLVQKSGRGKNTSAISRREIFERGETHVNILGGKYTTARRTAEKAVDCVDLYFGKTLSRKDRASLRDRMLPGGRDWTSGVRAALRTALEPLVAAQNRAANSVELERVINAALFRLGSRSKLLLEGPTSGLVACNNYSYLAGELEIACSKEHAVSPEDIILRRLLLQSSPGDLAQAAAAIKGPV